MKDLHVQPKLIAEMASCHNGDIDLAKRMIHEAKRAGVDIVKFQSWQSKNVDDADSDKARYASLELSDDAHYILKEECEKVGMEFLTTCYDAGRIPFLKELGLTRVKVASTDLKHTNFLKELRENFDEVIVSTGMSTEDEMRNAIDILKSGEFTIMHCVSVYPTPPEKANMRKLLWLKTLTPHVGYSDHTHGSEASIFSIGMGVKYIEKHFTLNRNMEQVAHTMGKGLKPVTTHMIANEPSVFKEISEWRDLYTTMLGTGTLEPLPEEWEVRKKYTGRLGTNT